MVTPRLGARYTPRPRLRRYQHDYGRDRRWTPEEDARVMAEDGGFDAALGFELGRTPDAIQRRRWQLRKRERGATE